MTLLVVGTTTGVIANGLDCHLDSTHCEHHDAEMRTTVTLDSAIAAKVKALANRRRTSFKIVLNDLLRRGLTADERSTRGRRFVVVPHAGGFRAGVDVGKLNQLTDQLEADDLADGTRRTR